MNAVLLPNPNARFKPRADAGLLSQLLQDCWSAVNAALEAERNAANVGEIVAAHLEQQFPADDMALLKRYGAAKAIEHISVRVYNPTTKRWDLSVGIDLPRAVMTPGHYGASEIHACGPRWSREPGRGLTDKGRADLASYGTTWESYCAEQDENEARMLPESVEPFFAKVVTAHAAYQTEYRQTTDWPADRKAMTGEWPTWAEIETAFPTLGAHIAKLRQTVDA